MAINGFIDRWHGSGAGERSNFQLFATELCDVLDIPKPDPAKPENAENDYVFERAVKLQNGDGTTTPNYIDLYHRDHFVMEAKQGSDNRDLEQERQAICGAKQRDQRSRQ